MRIDSLRAFPLFSSLPAGELERLAGIVREIEVPVGEILFTEGSSTEFFFIVLDGEVEIIKSLGTADERVFAVSKKDSILGEMSMFSQRGAHTASVRARTPVRLLVIPFAELDAILNRHPQMAYDLLRLYSRRLEESESLTIRDLREKNRQLTLAYQELKEAQAALIEKEKLEHELQLAAEIQRNILPENLPVLPDLDFGALMIPARLIGGDFFDILPLDERRIGVVVGDVCDKGVPAALFMALTYSSVRTEAFRQSNPGDMLRAVNQHLLQVNRSDMFVTLLYGVLDCQTGEFTYARAGHPEPLLLDGNNRLVNGAKRLGQPIGVFDEPAIDEQSITIPAGGTLLVYSDGLSETVEGNLNSPSLPELCSSALGQSGLGAQELCDTLWRTVGGAAAESLIQDDFTVVAMRNLGR